MNLSDHFSLEEMIFSEAAVRHHISNQPDAETERRLREVAQRMEAIRSLLKWSIRVTSGYRSPAVNAIVGGSPSSAHTHGWAVDFQSEFGSPLAVCEAIAASGIGFDQLIHEYGSWTHASFDPRARLDILTISHAAGTQRGLHRV